MGVGRPILGRLMVTLAFKRRQLGGVPKAKSLKG